MKEQESNKRFSNLEAETKDILETIQQIREDMDAVVEQNSELRIENEHLKKLVKQTKKYHPHELSDSKRNLEKLYNEGFHVCNQFYGKRRKNDSDCIFCTDIIYGER